MVSVAAIGQAWVIQCEENSICWMKPTCINSMRNVDHLFMQSKAPDIVWWLQCFTKQVTCMQSLCTMPIQLRLNNGVTAHSGRIPLRHREEVGTAALTTNDAPRRRHISLPFLDKRLAEFDGFYGRSVDQPTGSFLVLIPLSGTKLRTPFIA
jgi:hypothetical protein